MNQHAKYLHEGQRSFRSKVAVRAHTHSHTRSTALPGHIKVMRKTGNVETRIINLYGHTTSFECEHSDVLPGGLHL